MLTQDDLVDLLVEHLKAKLSAPPKPGASTTGAAALVPRVSRLEARTGGRLFLSEYDVRRRLNGGKTLKIPRGAIVSPLAQEWLALKGVAVVEE